MNRVDDLNYTFNHNQFMSKAMMVNLENVGDRHRCMRWIKKLSGCNRSVDEIKLRNDFMCYMISCLENRTLLPPFTENPPPGPLPQLASMLPGGGKPVNGDQSWNPDEKTKDQKPMLFQNSPDGGAFLAAQPIPKCGAFCYLAVVSKSPDMGAS